MAQPTLHIAEGHSINKPPYFNGEDYHYWKDGMRWFIESTSLDMWESLIKEIMFIWKSNHHNHNSKKDNFHCQHGKSLF